MHRLRKLLREIHRRSIWQVLGVYLGGAWITLEGVSILSWVVGLPDWVSAAASVLLALGLPVVALTAYVQRGVPALRGEYRDEVDPNRLVGRTPAEVHVDPDAHPLGGLRVFTWKNAILGGVGAATLLVGSVVAYFGMWAAGIGPMGSLAAQGLVAPGDQAWVAGFHDETGEGFGDLVASALRLGLAHGAVVQTGPDTSARLVLDGAVVPAGAGMRIGATLRWRESGDALATFRVDVDDPGGIMEALDRLAADIREKSGESLRSIRARGGLSDNATSSLDALRLFARAERALEDGDESGAARLLDGALGLDPDFVQARDRVALLTPTGG